MTTERHIQDPETEVLFHRPGHLHLERLVPDVTGSMCFRLHPWERAEDQTEMVLRGRTKTEEVLVRDARPSVKSRVRHIDGTDQHEHAAWVKAAQHAMSQGPPEKGGAVKPSERRGGGTGPQRHSFGGWRWHTQNLSAGRFLTPRSAHGSAHRPNR